MGSLSQIVKTKMKTVATFLLLAAVSVNSAPQLSAIKDFFSGLAGNDEPAGEGYEEREYPSVKWACTELAYEITQEDDGGKNEGKWNFIEMMKQMVNSDWKKRPSSEMFMKLFRYISGVNKDQEEIEMTVPVLTRMKILKNNMINKHMCFYLDQKHQENPPQPLDKTVTIEENKKFGVYVHQFGGYAMRDNTWITAAEEFAEVLAKDGRITTVDLNSFGTAGYDSPMKFWNRRNEVMFEVEENEV